MQAHPAGTLAGGALGAAAAGAAIGGVAGPGGAAVGAAIGAVAGGMTGQLLADLVKPELEQEFWQRDWSDRKYMDGGLTYDQDGAPAYRYGMDAYLREPGRSFDEVEAELGSGWHASRGTSRLDWDRARHASRHAWEHAHESATRGRPSAGDIAPESESAARSVRQALQDHGLRDSELPGSRKT